MSINNSPYGPPQYYVYPPPVSGLTPITAPNPLPTVQAADTAVFTPQPPPKDTISIGKAAKYGAGITAVNTLLVRGMIIVSIGSKKGYQFLKSLDKAALLGHSAKMATVIGEGALTGALLGYFLKNSQNPTQPQKPTSASIQQTDPKNAISVGKAAKYGALIGAGQSLSNIRFMLLSKSRQQISGRLGTKGLVAISPLVMAMGSALGALSGALVGYFLKRSEKQG